MLKLSLIVPCYNEEKTLPAIIDRTRALRKHVDLEIIIVNDCSTDNSLSIANALAEKYDFIQVYSHSVNQGKGAALKTGFLKATGDVVGVQDADMEYDPMDYLKLLEAIQKNQADVVYGSRYLLQTTRRVLYFWHTMMNRFLTFTSNMFTNLDLTDMETCYKLFRREVLQQLAPHLKENRFGFEPEITALVAQSKCRVWECAIHYNPRSYEEGKKINYKDGFHALYCILHYSAHSATLPMQLLLYFFIGGLSALVDIFMFAVLYLTGLLPLTLAVPGAFIMAAFVNYLLCIKILFKHKAHWNTLTEIMIYALIVLLMGAIDYGMTLGLVAMHLSPMWAKFLSALVGIFGNFALRKYIVFFQK